MQWEDRLTVRKGNLGEQLVEKYLTSKNFVIYRPTSGPHPFDRLVASADKKRIFIAEIKTKPSRNKYPDTGFDLRCNQDYLRICISHHMDVFVYFVDERCGWIYGNSLIENLYTPRIVHHNGMVLKYPIAAGGIIYFPLEAMEKIAQLPALECKRLADLSSATRGPQATFRY